MNHIHVEPELLFETARYIWQQQVWIGKELQELRALLGRLETVWQSPDALDWVAEGREWVCRVDEHLEKLEMLALVLHHQADKWQQAEERGRQAFNSLRRDGNI